MLPAIEGILPCRLLGSAAAQNGINCPAYAPPSQAYMHAGPTEAVASLPRPIEGHRPQIRSGKTIRHEDGLRQAAQGEVFDGAALGNRGGGHRVDIATMRSADAKQFAARVVRNRNSN